MSVKSWSVEVEEEEDDDNDDDSKYTVSSPNN